MKKYHGVMLNYIKNKIRGRMPSFLWKRKGKLAYLGYLWYNERVINHNEVMYCHI